MDRAPVTLVHMVIASPAHWRRSLVVLLTDTPADTPFLPPPPTCTPLLPHPLLHPFSLFPPAHISLLCPSHYQAITDTHFFTFLGYVYSFLPVCTYSFTLQPLSLTYISFTPSYLPTPSQHPLFTFLCSYPSLPKTFYHSCNLT